MNLLISQHVVEFAPLDLGCVLVEGQDPSEKPHHSGRLDMSIPVNERRGYSESYSHILRSPWYIVQIDDKGPTEWPSGS